MNLSTSSKLSSTLRGYTILLDIGYVSGLGLVQIKAPGTPACESLHEHLLSWLPGKLRSGVAGSYG
jgi:hypothetical protein